MCIAFPGMIISIDPNNEKGCVDFLGVKREVCLSLVPNARAGDFVLVHAGFAIEQLDSDMAEDLASMLKELGEKLEEAYGYEHEREHELEHECKHEHEHGYGYGSESLAHEFPEHRPIGNGHLARL